MLGSPSSSDLKQKLYAMEESAVVWCGCASGKTVSQESETIILVSHEEGKWDADSEEGKLNKDRLKLTDCRNGYQLLIVFTARMEQFVAICSTPSFTRQAKGDEAGESHGFPFTQPARFTST